MAISVSPDESTALPRAIRVSRFGEPEVLELHRSPMLAPGPDEVLVRVRAAAVTPLDTYLRAGLKVAGYAPALPYTPGNALSGEVLQIGSQVRDVVPGERVFGHAASGAYADEAVCKASRLYPLPAAIDFPAGAQVAVPYRTAFHALFDLARAEGGETVLIHGAAGSVGAAAVQLARAHGLHVLATCSSAAAEKVRRDGAHRTIDREGWAHHVGEAAGTRPISVIIEIAARENLAADCEVIAPGGRIVIVGGHGATPFDALPVIGKGLSIHGVSLPNIPPARDRQIMAAIVAGLENGTLRPQAPASFDLGRAAEAHAAIAAGRGAGGVVLLT